MAHTLAEVRSELVRIVCAKCGTRREFRTTDLRERYGPEQSLPGLLSALARAEGCSRVTAGNYSDWCGVVYDDPTGTMLRPAWR
jgi:hypothetical protein